VRQPAGLTVAVCTRNRPALLGRCLAALGRLDPPPDAILVADQSDARPGAECRDLCARQEALVGFPVRYLQVAPRGLGYSRQQVLEAVEHDLLAFTDDDCRPWPGWIGSLQAAFARHPRAGAITGPARPDPELQDDLPDWVSTWGGDDEQVFSRPTDPRIVGGGFNMSFRRQALMEVGGFDPLLGAGTPVHGAEDFDILHRLLRSGSQVIYTPGAVVSHTPPRDPLGQRRHERLYAISLGAWAAKGWREGDGFPGRCLRQTAGRNLYYVVRRGLFEGPAGMWHRLTVAWHMAAGWWRGARLYGGRAAS
jgi:GT2 family glycosyltransferase